MTHSSSWPRIKLKNMRLVSVAIWPIFWAVGRGRNASSVDLTPAAVFLAHQHVYGENETHHRGKHPGATLIVTPTREERKSRNTALALESTLLQLKFRRKSWIKVRSFSWQIRSASPWRW